MLKDQFPLAADAEHALDRRRFLCAAGAAALVALGGEWVGRRAGAAHETEPEVTLADVETLTPGEARVIAATDGREVLAVQLESGDVVAFDRRCPHLGCPVRWSAAHARFECPCHHAAFHAETGAVLFGPPRRGLVPARVIG